MILFSSKRITELELLVFGLKQRVEMLELKQELLLEAMNKMKKELKK
jgi:hypothetical protein